MKNKRKLPLKIKTILQKISVDLIKTILVGLLKGIITAFFFSSESLTLEFFPQKFLVKRKNANLALVSRGTFFELKAVTVD
jgi:hypothetical protein